jgi:hypothetical protein
MNYYIKSWYENQSMCEKPCGISLTSENNTIEDAINSLFKCYQYEKENHTFGTLKKDKWSIGTTERYSEVNEIVLIIPINGISSVKVMNNYSELLYKLLPVDWMKL